MSVKGISFELPSRLQDNFEFTSHLAAAYLCIIFRVLIELFKGLRAQHYNVDSTIDSPPPMCPEFPFKFRTMVSSTSQFGHGEKLKFIQDVALSRDKNML